MRRAARLLAVVLGLCAALLVSELGRRRAQRSRAAAAAPPGAIRHAPSAGVLRALSLGERSLAADLVMLRTIAYFADARAREARYPWLAGLLATVTDLDPGWRDAYLYGAYFLSGEAGAGEDEARRDKGRAERLLRRGMASLAHEPALQITAAGLYLTPPAEDRAKAKGFLRWASQIPGGHRAWVAQVRAGLETEAGRPAAAAEVYRRMMEQYAGGSSAADRRAHRSFRRLHVEAVAAAEREKIRAAAARYTARHGAPPARIGDLLVSGELAELPREPFARFLDTHWEIEVDRARRTVTVTSRGWKVLRYNRLVSFLNDLLASEGPGSFRAAHGGRPPRDLDEFARFVRGRAEAYFREREGRAPADLAELERSIRGASGGREAESWKILLKHLPGLGLPPHPLAAEGGRYRYDPARGRLSVEPECSLERLFGER